MSDNVTVDIVNVFDTARKGTADTLKAGDCLFDTFGGMHKLVKVSIGGRVHTVREDGVKDVFDCSEIVTRIPA